MDKQMLFDVDDVRKTLTWFSKPGEVFEIRVINDSNSKISQPGYFDDQDKAITALSAYLKSLPASRYPNVNVYFTLNPCNPALLSRSVNRFKAGKVSGTADKDILCLRRLLIDFDSVHPSDISSSDTEKKACLELALKVRRHLSDCGWPEPFQSDSGNGGHLIYTLPDIANTPGNVDLLKRVLKGLAKFDTTEAKVDLTTFNPARITKLYGTFARKGDNDIDNGRPHRMSKILHIPTEKVPVTIEQLNQIALPKDEPKQPERQESRKGIDSSRKTDSRVDVESYLNHYGREIIEVKPHDKSTLYTLSQCVFDQSHKKGESAIRQADDGVLFYHCFHDSCKGKTWKDARQIISGNDNLKPFMSGQNEELKEVEHSAQYEHVNVDDAEDIKPLTPDELNQLLVEPVAFPIDIFPDGFKALIEEMSDYFQTETGIAGTVALTVFSTAIGNTALCYFKEGYTVKPFVWSIVTEQTGFGKTPLIKELTKNTEARQEQSITEHEEAMKQYETDCKLYEFNQKEKLKQQKQKGKLFEIDLEQLFAIPEPAKPTLKQYISKDFTFESLVPMFCENPRGILIIKDELSAIITSMNQYKSGKGSDRENFLELFNCGALKVDRKGAKTLYAPVSGTGIIGGIQPAKMTKVFQTDSFDDGLLPRFLLVLNTSDTLPESTLAELGKDVLEYWQKLIGHYLKIEYSKTQITKYYLDDKAKQYHNNWINNFNALYPALSEKARVFIPKLHLYSLKFGLQLKAIENFETETEDRKITIDDVQKAHKLTEFYLSQVVQVCKLYADTDKKTDATDRLLIEILVDMFQATTEDKVLLNDVAVRYFARIKPGGMLKDKDRKKFNKSISGKIKSYGLEVRQSTDHKTFVFRNDELLKNTV
jgi:hypothetical protein